MSRWPMVRLGEVLRLDLDRVAVDPAETYPMAGVLSYGRGLFVREPISFGQTSYKSLLRLKAGQVVMSQLFGWEGALAVCPDEFEGRYVSTEFPTFSVDHERLDPGFISLYLRKPSTWPKLAGSVRGMGDRRDRLRPERFVEHEMPLPPLTEQRRIVAWVDGIQRRAGTVLSLGGDTTAHLGALEATLLRRYLPEDAAKNWVRLSSVVDEIENGASPATEGRAAAPDEWAVLKVGAVSFGRFDPNQNKALPPSFEPLAQYEVHDGDFLMARANTPDLVGACAIARSPRRKLMLSDKIFRFRFRDTAGILPVYLDRVLKSPALRAQIISSASGTSPTMKNISKAKVLDLRIPLPPLPEQRRIVAELDALQEKVAAVKALQAERSAALNALLPSILDRAFGGQV